MTRADGLLGPCDILGALSKVAEREPRALNYYDLLSCRFSASADVSSHKAWTIAEREGLAIAILSPDHSISIYSDSLAACNLLLERQKQDIFDRGSIVFSQHDLFQCIKYHVPTLSQPANTYQHMWKRAVDSPCPSGMHVSKASSADTGLVRNWISAFNEERGSSWEIPRVEDAELYLAFDGEDWIGGCAVAMRNLDRAWIGRLYVRPERRGRSAGRVIMQLVERRLSGDVLHLLVDDDNRPAIDLYRGLGYSSSGSNFFARLTGDQLV